MEPTPEAVPVPGPTVRVLYVGWVGFGNLGDDVCRDLFVDRFRRALASRGARLEVRAVTHQGISEPSLLEYRPHLVVLGGGSLFTVPYLAPLALAQKHGIPTAVWGTGIDKLPARCLDELLGGATRLTAWQDQATAAAFRDVVGACRWVGVRGPHTLRILRSAGCPAPPLHVSGDPGLLLEPEEFPTEPTAVAPAGVPPFLQAWIDAGEPIVGVNWGTANNQVFGGDERGVEEALKVVIRELVRRSYKVLLFAVWGPDLSAVRRLVAAFLEDAGVGTLPKVSPGPLLAWILRRCCFTVNFKLHANVFTAAAGRPFVSLGYRSKCYDFAASLGCEDLVVRFDEPDLAGAVLGACSLVEREHAILAKRIERHRRAYGKKLKTLVKRMAALALDRVES